MKARCRPWSQTTTGETVLAVRNFLFLTCSTRTRTLRLPQTIPHTITTSHTNRNPSLIIPPFLPPHSFSNNYHYDHRIPPFVTTNQPQSLQHNVPNNQYQKGSTPTRLELTTLGTAILATSVTPVKDPLVQRLTTLPLYLSIRGFQVHKQG